MKEDAMQDPGPLTPSGKSGANSLKPGFWKRGLAFVIDMILVSVPLFLIGLIFYDFFSSIGSVGRLLGIFPALAYFGFLNSKHGRGQTIGKRIFGLRVLGADDNEISLGRSLGRSALMLVPLHMSGIHFDPGMETILWLSPIILLILFAYFGIFYYFILNFANRRSVHDFLTATHVINIEGIIKPPATPRWLHIIYGIICTVAGVLLILHLIGGLSESQNTVAQLSKLQSTVSQHPGVRTARATMGTSYHSSSSGPSTEVKYISISVWPRVDSEELSQELPEIYNNLKKEAPFISQYDVLSFQIETGFQFGFASYSSREHKSHSIKEWDSLLSSDE
ncbi:MAG: RDD family protein [Leptospiraceae bacterium]